MTGIGLWKNRNGNLMTASEGLTEDQVLLLRSLEVGDRLIAYMNTKEPGSTYPDFTVKRFRTYDDKPQSSEDASIEVV